MTVCLIIHLFCKSCEPEIVFVLIFTLAEQFYVHKSYKMHESTLSCKGILDENIDMSDIHLTVWLLFLKFVLRVLGGHRISDGFFERKFWTQFMKGIFDFGSLCLSQIYHSPFAMVSLIAEKKDIWPTNHHPTLFPDLKQ